MTVPNSISVLSLAHCADDVKLNVHALGMVWRGGIFLLSFYAVSDHSGGQVELFFLTERIVYFLNTVHCYNTLVEYYYEIQIHKALCNFTVKRLLLVKGKPPPPDT